MKKYFFILCFLILFLSVIWKKNIIIKKNKKEEISFFTEWKKKGKPVIVKRITKNKTEKQVEIPVVCKKKEVLSYVPYEIYKKTDLNMKVTTIVGKNQLTGKIIGKNMDKESGLYTLSFDFPSINTNFNNIIVAFKEVEEGIYIPQDAVINKKEINYVFIIKDQKAVKKRIIIKKEMQNKYLVLGLNVQDLVVIRGQKTLKNNEKVNQIEKL